MCMRSFREYFSRNLTEVGLSPNDAPTRHSSGPPGGTTNGLYQRDTKHRKKSVQSDLLWLHRKTVGTCIVYSARLLQWQLIVLFANRYRTKRRKSFTFFI